MRSESRRQANKKNAQSSTGPRTIAGKRRSRFNAVKHGLGISVALDPEFATEITAFAKVLSEGKDSADVQLHARLVAESCIELQRIDAVRHLVINHALNDPEVKPISIKDAMKLLHFVIVAMRGIARFRWAEHKVKIGRATKAERLDAERASSWGIYMYGTMNGALRRAKGDELVYFDRAARELQKLARYRRRAEAKQRRAMRGLEFALATFGEGGKTF